MTIDNIFVFLDAIKPNMTPLVRKYAFHMILAGHRFGKSGQKRHAARAYQLALQVWFKYAHNSKRQILCYFWFKGV